MVDPDAVVERSAHLAGAAYLMRHAHVPELVVVDDGTSRTPMSIISAFDIVRAVSHACDPSVETVAQWQSAKPTFVRPETPLLDALDVMLDEDQPHLPVVGADDKLVGVIDLIGVVRALRASWKP